MAARFTEAPKGTSGPRRGQIPPVKLRREAYFTAANRARAECGFESHRERQTISDGKLEIGVDKSAIFNLHSANEALALSGANITGFAVTQCDSGSAKAYLTGSFSASA